MSSLPTLGGTTQAGAQGCGGNRTRARRLSLGGAPTGTGVGELTRRRTRRAVGERTMTRFGDGPRRRRMIRGTIVRIGVAPMRYELRFQLASADCTSSRRSTVMCALPRGTVVTTVYERDSSSKRPRTSVVSAAPACARVGDIPEILCGGHAVQGCAPYGRRLRRPWTARPPQSPEALMPAS